MQDKIYKMDDEYGFLTEELLRKEYCENRLTDKQIAEKYNVGSKATIWKRRKFLGIANLNQNKSNSNASKNRLYSISLEDANNYINQGLSFIGIAEKMGCSRMVVYRRLKELGLIEDRKFTVKI